MKHTEFRKHLEDRGFSDSIRVLHIDWDNEVVYFPLWSPLTLVGYQRYEWKKAKKHGNEGRYFTWISKSYSPLALWGLDRLSSLDECASEESQRVLVTEGIWDAIRCIQAGYNAVAILTATPNAQFVQWFKMVMQGRNAIAILDNDENGAGRGLAKLCVSSIMCERHKDIGEHSPDGAKQWLKDAINHCYGTEETIWES